MIRGCLLLSSCYFAHPGYSQGLPVRLVVRICNRLPAGVCSHLQQHCALCHGWPQWYCVCLWSHQQWQDVHNDGEALYACMQSPVAPFMLLGLPLALLLTASLAQPARRCLRQLHANTSPCC